MPNAASALFDDPGAVLRNGARDKRADTLRRVTDLFVNDTRRLNDEHIAAFDEVIEQSVNWIEAKTPAEISAQPLHRR